MIAYRIRETPTGAFIVQYRKDNYGPWKNIKEKNHNGTPVTVRFWGLEDAQNFITQQGGNNGQY